MNKYTVYSGVGWGSSERWPDTQIAPWCRIRRVLRSTNLDNDRRRKLWYGGGWRDHIQLRETPCRLEDRHIDVFALVVQIVRNSVVKIVLMRYGNIVLADVSVQMKSTHRDRQKRYEGKRQYVFAS